LEIDYSRYRMKFDYHTHTTFSHGTGSIEDNVKAAIAKGLKGVAITDHGPGHLTYGVKRADVPEMRAQVEKLKTVYPEIEIFLGVEANIVAIGKHLDVHPSEFADYDFVIGGYHYGVLNGYCVGNWLYSHGPTRGLNRRWLMVKNTDMTVKALYENNLKILTHPGDKGPFDMAEIAKACAETDTLMEISSRHKHLTAEEIKIAAKTDAKFIISSDAHAPELVGSYEGGISKAIEAGLDMSRIVNIEEI